MKGSPTSGCLPCMVLQPIDTGTKQLNGKTPNDPVPFDAVVFVLAAYILNQCPALGISGKRQSKTNMPFSVLKGLSYT